MKKLDYTGLSPTVTGLGIPVEIQGELRLISSSREKFKEGTSFLFRNST